MAVRSVLISGLGIGGPSLAFWLRRFGFEPTIVEIAPEPRQGGYMIDFWGVGYETAGRMGLIPAIRDIGYHIEEVRFVNDRGHRISGISGNSFRAALGDKFTSLLRSDLARVIYDKVKDHTPVLFDDEITALNETSESVDVTFRKAAARRFDLVIGADGLHSAVRRMTFGPGASYVRELDYRAAAFTTTSYPHRDENTYTSFSRPGRQIARYALRDGSTAFLLVWRDASPPPRHDIAAQTALIRKTFDGMGWEWPDVSAALDRTNDLYFDAVSQTHMPAWSKGRIGLIGDAAWCPSLLAGEGTAFAMAGAYILAGELARTRDDHTGAFQRFETRYRPFIEKKQTDAVNFASQFAPSTPMGLWLRNTATHLLQLPVIGGWMMRFMAGDNFDLPDMEAGTVASRPGGP